MKKNHNYILLGLVIISLVLLYFRELSIIPFHPDEATFIYTSQDFDVLVSNPLQLAWEPGSERDPLMRYRLMDEPISRLVFGLARKSAGITVESIALDWDWMLSWAENESLGAVPDQGTLNLMRATSTSFVIIAGVLLFFAIKRISNSRSAVIVLIFFSMNGLVLLHGRRSMREGLMLFGICLFLWSLKWAADKPWLTGFAAAIMLSSRYSTAPLVLVGLVATAWEPAIQRDFKQSATKLFKFSLAFAALFLFFQPVLWRHPIGGLQQMLLMRLEFTQGGITTAKELAPGVVLSSIPEKFGGLVYQGFLGPVSYSEFSNYEDALSASINDYGSFPLYHLWRGFIWGGIFLFLTVAGVILAIYRLFKQPDAPRKFLILLLCGLVLEMAFILLTVPFPFQRYYLPLLPFFSILAGLVFVSWDERPISAGSRTP